jgi:DNA/RNA endonuclease G (NUC1)
MSMLKEIINFMDLNLMGRYTLTVLLTGLFSFSYSQQNVEFNIDGLFKGVYSESLEQPLEVTYTVKCPNGKASRNGMDFYTDDNIHTSDDDDYSNNVWDKGHLAPAAAFSCDKETLRKTFTYLNSALQHQGLNRGQWNQLESFERDLANFFTVEVKIEVLFEGNLTVLSSGATVPSGFKKTIKFSDKTVVFEFPNTDTKGTNWIDYKVN